MDVALISNNTLDQIGDIGKGLSGYVAVAVAIIALFAAKASSRSAKAAERQVEAQMRPFLVDFPQQGLKKAGEEYQLPNGKWEQREIEGQIKGSEEERWITVYFRNVGQGVALLEEVTICFDNCSWSFGRDDFTAKKAVPAGDTTVVGAMLDKDDQHADKFAEIFKSSKGLSFSVTYTDFAGEQRSRVTADIGNKKGTNAKGVLGLKHENVE